MRGSCRNPREEELDVVLVVSQGEMVRKTTLCMNLSVNIQIVKLHTEEKVPEIYLPEIHNINTITGEVRKVLPKLKTNPSCIKIRDINMRENKLYLRDQFLDHIRIA